MKLMYLMTEPMEIGGVQSDMLALSEDLTKRDHEVWVGTTPGVTVPELEARGGKLANIDFNFSGLGGLFRAAKALRKFVRENKIDVLAPQSVRTSIVCYVAARLMPFSYKIGNGKRIPIVTTIHNIHNPMHFKYGGHILQRCADYVIFESHYERNRLLASGLGADKSEVIHSGIDTDKFQPIEENQALLDEYGIDKSTHKVLGIVARLSEEKGHNLLLPAFKKVLQKFPNTKLLVVGDGPLKADVDKIYNDLELHNDVILTGLKRNIAEHLSIFDAFVLSSTRESFPLAAREAMAAGVPAIVPKIGGCPEVVDENITGLCFEAGNIDDLADKMMQLLEVEDRCKEFGNASRERVVRLFSRQQWMDGDERVYLDAMA